MKQHRKICLEKESLRGILINVSIYLIVGNKENGAIAFPVVSSEGMKGNGHVMRCGIVHFNTRTCWVFFFTVKLVEY